MPEENKINAKQVLEELKGPSLIVLGILGGSMAGKLIDKTLKVDPSQKGLNAKALAKPVLQLSAGIGGAIFLKDENLKLIATGLTASGIASTVKVLVKKDILSGFKGLGENLQAARQLLKAESYKPNLPELQELQEENYQSVQIEYAKPTDNFEEYEEIQEVDIL